MKDMSLDEIEEVRLKILENARELVEEASILLLKKRFARAYTLAHLACEETSKISIIIRAFTESTIEGDTDWKSHYKRMRDHISKIELFLIAEYYDLEKVIKDEEIDAEIKKMKDDYGSIEHKRVEKLNILKNKSIYTDFINNVFYKPSEVITEEMAINHIEKASRVLNTYEIAEKEIKIKFEALKNDPEFKQKYSEIWNKLKNEIIRKE